jgi:hypothetical protein
MSETAAQPWWADVQHLRPRLEGRREHGSREHATARTGRFQRSRGETHDAPLTSPLAAAVAVAEVNDLPRLDDIDWHDFVAGHAELEEPTPPWLDEAGPKADPKPWLDATPPAAETPAVDPLAELDWQLSEGSRKDRRRTVEIRGQVGSAATAPVDPVAAASVAPRGRAARRPVEPGFQGRPDRVAMWAFVLGLLLMLVALISTPEADAAVRALAG